MRTDFKDHEDGMKAALFALLSFCSPFFLYASLWDVMDRAQVANYLPSLSLGYNYNLESNYLISFAMRWEFDDSFNANTWAAMQISRLEKEKNRFSQAAIDLEQDHPTTID